jgi:hypothetical protein
VAVGAVIAACATPSTSLPDDVSVDPKERLAREILRAESDAGVGAVDFGSRGELVVYVHTERVEENLDALAERLSDTYGVPVDVREGAPIAAAD